MTQFSSSDIPSIRKQMMELRLQISPEQGRAAAHRLAALLATVIPAGDMVAGYNAIRGEMSLMPAMEELHARGQRLCLPVVETLASPLIFRQWQPGQPLMTGRYGIAIPDASSSTAQPRVILTPLLAFDRSGNRLGYGGGYYDRTIRALRQQDKRLQIIGVAYAFQEVEQLLPQAHDERMDSVVTDNEMIRIL